MGGGGGGGGGVVFLFSPGAQRFFLKGGGMLRYRPQATTAVRGISGESSSAGVLTKTGNHAFNVSCTRGRFVV